MFLFHSSTSALLFLLSTVVATSALTVVIPPSNLLPNPNALSSDTHATLSSIPPPTRSKNAHVSPHLLTAPLTRSATFIFQDLDSTGKPESYLLDVRSAEYVFTPYRVDVAADGTVLGVWETFRGNPWENRGAERYVLDAASVDTTKLSEVAVDAKVLARRGFYEERPKFSPLALFKNPMILLALVALGFTFGMPKLMENMDPEMRAEFEKHSRASPISGATRSAMTGGSAPGNFDFAGWMAGAHPRPAGPEPAALQGVATGREGGNVRRRG
ncbi:hypothetical protein BDV38DRAFT_148665 [Aspergillus pseudotamarii]|uniref:ER membrane protein complex subunit 7 beta-sandwich domain-containing protein n=1 Tax=Aspergillus pseudotamarii TaxID=132259 RepID=A0A5N6SNE4_ASPPS|nr:uncharacterized protein BDV38DRAFT_148665 [Aspergillus pseudotamarii]KAE8134893.1 hypothetical protein BDV38DRAFT_148665 [Aspergillus pseudotamarii]